MKSLILIAGFAALSVAAPAAGQSDSKPPESNSSATTSPCQAKPDDNRDAQAGSATDSNNLTAKLDDCNGVLKPPPTGDTLAEPAPDQGKTPVIKPGEVPAQPKSD